MAAFNEIKTRNELANFLMIPRRKLTHILFVLKPDNCYTEFSIPKRSGGSRVICAPSLELKSVQKKLAVSLQIYQRELREQKNIHTNISHAYEHKKGIITNARIHRNKRYVLNMDLEDFFGTIHFGRVMGYFEKNNSFKMPHEVAVSIAQLCCYEGKLPQGAPTSPVISNMICEILDYQLLQISKNYKLDYTRYADDLTFSTNDKNFLVNYNEFLSAVNKIICKYGFAINKDKTRLQYRDSRQTVTGLIVNKKLSIDRRYVRDTRAMANSLYCTGEFTINGETGTIAQLEGRFAFIDQLDKYNNKQLKKPLKERKLNSREMQYQRFLFYKYFYANSKPVIITEGKTDILYLKAALMSLHQKYPALIFKKKDGTFEFHISFLRRSKKLRYFFNISSDGADTLKNIYYFYTGDHGVHNLFKFFAKNTSMKPNHPVMMLFDNELADKNKPIRKFLKATNDKEEFKKVLQEELSGMLVPNSNLYVITNPLIEGMESCEIEHLFTKATLSIIIDGKRLSLSDNPDTKAEYGKHIFSQYVFEHYSEIDFSGFIPLLDKLNNIVQAQPLTD